MKFTKIRATAFDEIQLNAGVLSDTFTPASGEIGDIIAATSGNDPKGFGDFISPDNRFVSAANHANHAPSKPVFKAALAFAIVNASDLHHIAIESVSRFRGGNKKLPFGSLHKTVSSARHLQNALRQNARGAAGGAFSCT